MTEIAETDLRIDVFRISPVAGWAGPLEYMIRVEHLPSGIVAQSSSEKTQILNRDKCIAEIKAQLRSGGTP